MKTIDEVIEKLTRRQSIQILKDHAGFNDEEVFDSSFWKDFTVEDLRELVSDNSLNEKIPNSAIMYYENTDTVSADDMEATIISLISQVKDGEALAEIYNLLVGGNHALFNEESGDFSIHKKV